MVIGNTLEVARAHALPGRAFVAVTDVMGQPSRRDDARWSRTPQAPGPSIEIEHALVAALARRRDVSVARLVHDLLNVVATDQLTTAILDD